MLDVKGLSFGYAAARPVLRGVSLSLEAGTVTAIVGPNGAGKSTLLRLMAGVLRPGAGHVRLEGTEVSSMGHGARARRIGYMAQRSGVAFAFGVREFVRLGRYTSGSGEDGAAVDRALARVGLLDRAGEPLGVLSAGQQQRAALARVVAQLDGGGPLAGRVLLADEPVSAMDPRHALETMALLRDMASRGGAVAVVLHDLNLALRHCSRAVVLEASGRVAASGETEATLTAAVLGPVFEVRFEELGAPGGPGERALVAAATGAGH